jgi:hypothetical protein
MLSEKDARELDAIFVDFVGFGGEVNTLLPVNEPWGAVAGFSNMLGHQHVPVLSPGDFLRQSDALFGLKGTAQQTGRGPGVFLPEWEQWRRESSRGNGGRGNEQV